MPQVLPAGMWVNLEVDLPQDESWDYCKPPDTLNLILWETLIQKQEAKIYLDSWSTETKIL